MRKNLKIRNVVSVDGTLYMMKRGISRSRSLRISDGILPIRDRKDDLRRHGEDFYLFTKTICANK